MGSRYTRFLPNEPVDPRTRKTTLVRQGFSLAPFGKTLRKIIVIAKTHCNNVRRLASLGWAKNRRLLCKLQWQGIDGPWRGNSRAAFETSVIPHPALRSQPNVPKGGTKRRRTLSAQSSGRSWPRPKDARRRTLLQ